MLSAFRRNTNATEIHYEASSTDLNDVQKELATLRAAVDCAQTAIMMVDRDFIVTYVNEQTKVLLETNEEKFGTIWPGFKASEVVGTSIDTLLQHSSDLRSQMGDVNSLPITADITIADLTLEVKISAQTAASGDYIGNTLEWRDVADLRAKQAQNTDYRGQLEAIGRIQAVIAFQPDGTILEANDNFLTAMGYVHHEIVGKHHRIFVDPVEANGADYQSFWSELAAGRGSFREFRRIAKDGSEVWIQAAYSPIPDETGKIVKVVKFASDISDRVQQREKMEKIGVEVDGILGQITTAIGDVNNRAADASQRSNDTAERVQSVAASAEEFSASVGEIAQSMTASTQNVSRAIEETDTADTSAQRLTSAATSMNGIVETIQKIASQINLLALNATIEAARAGEAGKGFAVVASEVKSLANQVAKATEEISDEINGIQGISSDVVGSLENIKTAIEAVNGSVTGVASAVEEQSATTNEINSSLQVASGSVSDINSALDTISGAVGEASTLAQQGMELYRSLQSTTAD